MIQFLRRLFRMCQHEWTHPSKITLNEFHEVNETEILSTRDFNRWSCARCKKVRYRKV